MHLEKEAEIRDVWGREAQRQAEGLPVRPTMRDRATGDVIALLEALDEARAELRAAQRVIEAGRNLVSITAYAPEEAIDDAMWALQMRLVDYDAAKAEAARAVTP